MKTKKETKPIIRTELDKQFGNNHTEIWISYYVQTVQDNSGPWATTGTSKHVATIVTRIQDLDVIKKWAESVWKSSYLIDEIIEKIEKCPHLNTVFYITIRTTVWYN